MNEMIEKIKKHMAHVDLTLIFFYICIKKSNNYIQVSDPLFVRLSIHTYIHTQFCLYTLLLKNKTA